MSDADELTEEEMDDFDRMIPILRKVHELLEDKRAAIPDVPHMAIAIARKQHHAERLLELWQKYHGGEQAECYHSGKPAYEQGEIIRRIKNNELSLVIVVGMLLEGFDHPPISIAAITYSIKSPLRFVQFTGRAQRIYRKDDYTDELLADIITHKDYKQKANYDYFIQEALIPRNDAENVDDEQ
jgi:superfamily II DNA or RNA helicase